MSIDWSKAPFDAEAGTAKSDHYFAAWYRRDGNGQVQQICDEAGFKEWTWMGGRKEFPLASELRPKAVAPWPDEGYPPVGIEIEAMLPGIGSTTYFWQKAKVVHGPLPESPGEILVFSLETTRPAWVDEFRPVRTAEQIEAEERAAAVEDMWNTYWKPEPQTAKEALGLLWDAGWRKQVQP